MLAINLQWQLQTYSRNCLQFRLDTKLECVNYDAQFHKGLGAMWETLEHVRTAEWNILVQFNYTRAVALKSIKDGPYLYPTIIWFVGR